MKKFIMVLCAALALSAALSAGGTASAAVFSDSDQIQYKTAVGVMNGAGILYGYSDNAFRPKSPITREQAAKLLTYVVLGEDGVASLPRGDTGFSDVAATRWSAPYIKWCRDSGYIVGMGDGTYDPEGNVTGYQLAKMLLCAAGYGKNGEYSGVSWALQAAKDGFSKGIFTGIADSNPDKAVSREEAAFYVFNGMTKLERVVYDAASGKYVPADGTAAADNTFGAAVYGIVLTGDKATTASGMVTENSADGETGTVVSGTHYSYETGFSLLGHQVTVYTNGLSAPKQKIYYIADESSTVELPADVSERDAFEAAFSKTSPHCAPSLLVFDETGVLGSATTLSGFDPESFKAPAGTYIFTGGILTAWFPPVEEYASVVGSPTLAGTVRLGSENFDAETVYSESGELTAGEIVLVKKLGGKIDVSAARSFEMVVTNIEYDKYYTPQAFIIGNASVPISSIRNESGSGLSGIYEVGRTYRFYCDSDGRTFAVVPVS